MKSLLLGVNVDHVATLRQARKTVYPNVLQAACEAERAGANGITAHLREDRRHIQERDIWELKSHISTRLNLEMAPTEPMILLAEKLQPAYCCLVPEKRQELTTEGGLDLIKQQPALTEICARLAEANIMVSLFIDPDMAQIECAKSCGAPFIEINTGKYAEATSRNSRQNQLKIIEQAASFGKQLGLKVNAGHGLNYENVGEIVKISNLTELNIGHAIVAEALFTGFYQAVLKMRALIEQQGQK